jgi:hypothetical protein
MTCLRRKNATGNTILHTGGGVAHNTPLSQTGILAGIPEAISPYLSSNTLLTVFDNRRLSIGFMIKSRAPTDFAFSSSTIKIRSLPVGGHGENTAGHMKFLPGKNRKYEKWTCYINYMGVVGISFFTTERSSFNSGKSPFSSGQIL